MLDQGTLNALRSNPGSLEGGFSGSGYYAKVYEGPLPGTVIKRGRMLDDGWLVWAGWCMSHPDRPDWMPRILALHVDENTGQFWAIMEKLTDQRDSALPLASWPHYGHPARFADHANNVPVSIKHDVMEEWSAMCAAFEVDNLGTRDTHSGNWMRRGDQLVLTDPLCDPEPHPVAFLKELAAQSDLHITFAACEETLQ